MRRGRGIFQMGKGLRDGGGEVYVVEGARALSKEGLMA